MKTQGIFCRWVVFSLMLFSVAHTAQARSKTEHRQISSESRKETSILRYSQAAESGAEGGKFGFGFSTVSAILPSAGGSALTGILKLDDSSMIHAFLAISNSSPFTMGFSVLYKKTVHGGHGTGFHLGGGLGFGSASPAFAVNIALVGGFHFEMPGAPQVAIHLDGGPSLTLVTSTPTSTTFALNSFSPLFGASVLYFF